MLADYSRELENVHFSYILTFLKNLAYIHDAPSIWLQCFESSAMCKFHSTNEFSCNFRRVGKLCGVCDFGIARLF